MSTRREQTWRFEHGAPHTDRLHAMRSAATDASRPLHISFGAQVQQLGPMAAGWNITLDDGRLFNAAVVLLAIPAPQAVALLDRRDSGRDREAVHGLTAPIRNALAAVEMSPCWSGMFATDAPFRLDALPLLGDDALQIRAQPQTSRSGADDAAHVATAWVAQTGAAWSSAHLELDAREIESRLTAAIYAQHAQARVRFMRAHRWRYARVTRGLAVESLWMGNASIGACGDWGGATLEESERAVTSGRALAGVLLAHYNIASIG